MRAAVAGDYDRAVTERSPEPRQSKPRRSRRDSARTSVIVVLGVVIALFAVQNRGKVQVDWIVDSGRAPLIIVIAVSLLLGAAIAWLGDRAARRRGPGSSPGKPPS